jgi:hypothetical protein
MLASKSSAFQPLGVAIDCGAFVSMFACVLACATAAARVFIRMANRASCCLPNCEHTSPALRNPQREQSLALSIALMFAATTATGAFLAIRRI